MQGDQVKYTDLFSTDINSGLNSLKVALEEVVKQIAALKQEATALKAAISSSSTATRQQQQDMSQDAAEVEKLNTKLKVLTGEEARLKAQIADANKALKLQAQVDTSVAGSLNELRAKYKALEDEMGRYDLKTKQGQKDMQSAAAEARKLKEEIRRLESAYKGTKVATTAASGSLNEMRAKYKQLVAEMGTYNLKTEEGRRKMQTTAAQARKLRDEIYKLEASYGQFGRNVGNYTGALSRFSARLKEAAARFVAFNAAFLSFTGGIRFAKALFDVRKELESTLVIYKALVGEVQGAKIFE